MKQALIIKLAPTEEQYGSLLQTMERFNEACNFVAGIAFGLKTANKIRLQKVAYQDVRGFGLSAQMTIRAISKVSEAYKRDRSIKPTFKPHSAMVYDQRILSWKGLDRVSILTLKGRQIIPIRIGAYQEARLDRKVRQCDLILRKGTFYLALTLDAPELAPDDPTGVLGVDLGIVHLAVDSDGEFYSGKEVDKVRKKTDKLKASLQSKGTKSAKRHLKKLSGREANFRRNTKCLRLKTRRGLLPLRTSMALALGQRFVIARGVDISLGLSTSSASLSPTRLSWLGFWSGW